MKKDRIQTFADGLSTVTCVQRHVIGTKDQYENIPIKRSLNVGLAAGFALRYCGTNPKLPERK